MKKLKSDIIIVGAGVGGATVAHELAKKGRKVLIIEKGHSFPQEKTGTELFVSRYYDKFGFRCKTVEGVHYYRTIMMGGTSVVSCGNAVESLKKEFKKIGIDLTGEFRETSKDLNIKPVPKSFIGKGTKKIMRAADKLGFKMELMPKLIDFKKCVACGNCVLGCRTNAKWTARHFLNSARDNGVSLIEGMNVTKVLISRGRVRGIEGYNQAGEKTQILGKLVILSAGGIGTPIILQNSGIKAGRKLFLDLFSVTCGVTPEPGSSKELTMAAVSHNKGFILSPFIDPPFALASVVPLPLRRYLKIMLFHKNMLGIMVKIKDDSVGKVHPDGRIEKKVTPGDLSKLNKGTEIAKKILIEAGVDPKTIMTTKIRGAHPGGTAAIGEVVNKDLETKVKGLFVCDASVLPTSPGLPPIVTIIAIAKRLAKKL
jgi:choline dehydrogenase-like flavoprotein